MKHYPHHIGDFDKATRHLTRIERSVYRDLIDLYYDTEQPLPLDQASICRKIIARSNEESTAVEQVLNEFFTEIPTGWYHERCEEEISKYHANNSQKALAGKASAAAKALKKQQALNGDSTDVATDVERTNNGTSTNQSTINQSTNQPVLSSPPTVSNRATKKCPASFIPTKEMRDWALMTCPDASIAVETDKLRDHTFKTARSDWPGTWRNWMRKAHEDAANRPKARPAPESFKASDDREARARWEEMTGRTHPDNLTKPKPTHGGMVVDVTPKSLEISQ